MIDKVAPTAKQPLGPPYYPVTYHPSNPPYYYQDLSIPTLKRTIEIVSKPGARKYELKARFHYLDSTSSGTTAKYLDFPLPSATTQGLGGGEIIEVNWYSGEMFDYIYSKLIDNEPQFLVARRAIKIDYIVTGGNQVFVDFLNVNAPSNTVAQDKPAYTNIDGGFGIFGCRSTLHVSKEFHTNTLNYLASQYPYCNLHFKNASGNISGTCFP